MFSRSCLFPLIHCSSQFFSYRARERQLCIFIATKEIIYMRKHGRRFIVSGNQYVCRNIFYEYFVSSVSASVATICYLNLRFSTSCLYLLIFLIRCSSNCFSYKASAQQLCKFIPTKKTIYMRKHCRHPRTVSEHNTAAATSSENALLGIVHNWWIQSASVTFLHSTWKWRISSPSSRSNRHLYLWSMTNQIWESCYCLMTCTF